MLSQPRTSWLLTILVSAGAWFLSARPATGQPHVPLAICPAIDADNDFEGEDDSRPVVLMVRGKFQQPLDAKDGVLDLQIEEVLFGNDPGRVIPFERLPKPDFFEWYRGQNVLRGGIYSFACTRRDGRLVYDSDAYRFLHRHMPESELTAARTIAAARFDRLVLGCRAIVIGRPKVLVDTKDNQPRMSNAGPLNIPHPPKTDGIKLSPETIGLLSQGYDHEQNIRSRQQTVVVERSLFGSFKPDDEFRALLGYRATPIPLTGDGPFLYFIADEINGVQQLETVWNVGAEPQVRAALARREQHPLVKSEFPGGKSTRREIQFPGTIAEAIALLDSNEVMARQLGIDRLLHEGTNARKEIAQAIEASLFRVREEPNLLDDTYYQLWRLTRLLGKLEREQPTGEVHRLIELLLTRAHAGTSFPLQSVERNLPAHVRRRFNPYATFDVEENHSLAWLLKELPPNEAARRYLNRLKQLRDLTSYGWGQEAQAVIDRLQLEDRLALPTALAASKDAHPLRTWNSELPADEIDDLRFAPNNVTLGIKLHTGLRRAWNSSTGMMVRNESGSSIQREERWRQPIEWIAEDAQRWTFFAHSRAYRAKGWGYGPPGAMDIVVTAANEQATWSSKIEDRDTEGVFEVEVFHPGWRGRVEFVAQEEDPPCGLIPGNEWLFVRSNIYTRKDLRLISSANVLGKMKGISFSAKGNRYAVITLVNRRDPDPDEEFDDDYAVFRRVRTDDREVRDSHTVLRIHDSASGRTLFATKLTNDLLKVAISPNGNRVAAVDIHGEVVVFKLPEVAAKGGSP